MLDFAAIRDDQAASGREFQFHVIGGIEEEEFFAAQAAGVIEAHADYYGMFRWSSEQVKRKLAQLVKLDNQHFKRLIAILEQAQAVESGITTCGD